MGTEMYFFVLLQKIAQKYVIVFDLKAKFCSVLKLNFGASFVPIITLTLNYHLHAMFTHALHGKQEKERICKNASYYCTL